MVLTPEIGPSGMRIFGYISDEGGMYRCRRNDSPMNRSRLLKEAGGVGAAALRFKILTAMRSGSVRRATWEQFSEHLTIQA